MTNRFISAVLAILLWTITPAVAVAGFSEGFAAYSRKDFATALREFTPLVAQGDADAQFALGVMYAAGLGVPQDYKLAASLHRQAAEQGQAFAQNDLGVMYFHGHGVPLDDKEAVKWFRMAAEQGNVNAQVRLGFMYAAGRGVAHDDKEAVRWFLTAAEQHDPNAQVSLGLMFQNGTGVLKNNVIAYSLYNLSAANNPSAENKAGNHRQDVMKKMSRLEIEDGQALTREMLKPSSMLIALDRYLKRQKN